VCFSTNNIFLASGDVEGNLKIYWIDDLTMKKEYDRMLGGAVKSISWNDESNKIFLCGDGKKE
jgi:hypothetical protein